MRQMVNAIAAPQGPFIKRSGSAFIGEARNHAHKSITVSFDNGDDEEIDIEFSGDGKLRFLLSDGIMAYPAVSITEIISTNPFTFLAPGNSCVAGDQVGFAGFPFVDGLNGRIFNVVGAGPNVVTTDGVYDGSVGAVVGRSMSRVYTVAHPYTDARLPNMRPVQSLDVMYLFCDPFQPRKLSRYGTYDWRLELIILQNGPFLPEPRTDNGNLTLSGTGNPVTGGTPFESGHTGAFEVANAFDNDEDTYWQSDTNQAGIIGYEFAAPTIITGFVIYLPRTGSTDTSFTTVDGGPGDFTFEGSLDNVTWKVLTSEKSYLLYEGKRSAHFTFNNEVAYTYYRLNITAATRNGAVKPAVSRLVMTPKVGATLTVTLAGTYTNVNNGNGFESTDAARLLRVKGSDQRWRIMRILSQVNHTIVNAQLLSEPFLNTDIIFNWQMAYWSDTTGWPIVGVFMDDRLWMGGASSYPDMVAGSRVGSYEDFEQRTQTNEVLDDSAVVFRLNARKRSRIKWMETDERALVIGTGSAEWAIQPQNADQALTARNAKARRSTNRGSVFADPVTVDKQILHVDKSGRTLREIIYQFQADGYTSNSMSLFASHLGIPRFLQIVYASEPHNLIFARREDNSIVALTYNREHNVIGWHRHTLGCEIEWISTNSSIVDKQDKLTMVTRRLVNGEYKRYIERLSRFWDFDSTLDTALYRDCALRYQGPATETIYGAHHLEGMEVSGLADGVPFGPVTVADGRFDLPIAAENVVFGLPYEAVGEISRPEGGAADGTAQGKEKRPNNASLLLWDSYGGEIGRYDEDRNEYVYAPIEYTANGETTGEMTLVTEMNGPHILPEGYGKRGSIAFKHSDPTPFNVVSLMFQSTVQDR